MHYFSNNSIDINMPIAHIESIAVAHPMVAALPPGIQRTRELLALLQDPRLFDLLGSAEMIELIEKTEMGYLLYTDHFKLAVNVHYLPRTDRFAGPVKFALEFEQPVQRGDVYILPHPDQLGALPPAAQRIRELVAILSDPRLYEIISSIEMIESIDKTEHGYSITTHNRTLMVEVIYGDAQGVGPIPFEIEFAISK